MIFAVALANFSIFKLNVTDWPTEKTKHLFPIALIFGFYHPLFLNPF
jgi:hypothetical protein